MTERFIRKLVVTADCLKNASEDSEIYLITTPLDFFYFK